MEKPEKSEGSENYLQLFALLLIRKKKTIKNYSTNIIKVDITNFKT